MRYLEITENYNSNVTKRLTSTSELQHACDLINAGGQLSWELTPSRLLSKLGNNGAIFGLYNDDKIVGTIGLKSSSLEGHNVAEVGYLYVDPSHRNFPNLTKLYAAVSNHAPNYDIVYATTVTTNRVINKLLQRNSKIEMAFSAQSPFSSNTLNYWIAVNTKMDHDQAVEVLKNQFSG